ncbi:MAG TPA: type II toxin-antitoxin system VapC family toxin [Chitinophagaceae bacterium]|nr:type II toxin-antitoxin system VapC family toxin [Chitinophagaceae bacterium]
MKTDNQRLLADTNIILYLFDGNNEVRQLIDGYEIFISVITELELLRFTSLTKKEFELLRKNLQELKIVDINEQIKELVYEISRKRKIKLSDCIIAATASYLNIPLVTADKSLDNIPSVNTILINF